jgi:hypothetical protein
MKNFEKKQNLKSYAFYFFKKYITIENQCREDHNIFLYWYHKCDCILTGKYITSCNNCKSTQKRVWYLHKSILEDHYIFVYWYQKHV